MTDRKRLLSVLDVLGSRAIHDVSVGLKLKHDLSADLERHGRFGARSRKQEKSFVRAQQENKGSSGSLTSVLSADTPCASVALCKLHESIANKCSYVRETMQALYQVVNI